MKTAKNLSNAIRDERQNQMWTLWHITSVYHISQVSLSDCVYAYDSFRSLRYEKLVVDEQKHIFKVATI